MSFDFVSHFGGFLLGFVFGWALRKLISRLMQG